MDTQPPSHDRDLSHLSTLIHLIYEAGLDPEKWIGVMVKIAQSFGTSKCLLCRHYFSSRHGGTLFSCGLSEETLELWSARYINYDIQLQRMSEQQVWKAGDVLMDEQILLKEELPGSPFDMKFPCSLGIARLCTGFVFANDKPDQTAISLAVFRDIDQPDFDQSDVKWMKVLVSHISRCLGRIWQLDSEVMKYTSALSSFDRLPFGVALLDTEMCVLHMNEAARSIVERRDGIFIDGAGHLDGVPAREGRPGLFQWLMTVKDLVGKNKSRLPECCLIHCRQRESHYAIQCSAIARNSIWTNQHQDTCYVAFITTPGTQQLPTAERLMGLYELTQSQARVALAFASGDSYKDVARRLSISEETVRSHVKKIYPKTRVNRQVDLVRLVLSLRNIGI